MTIDMKYNREKIVTNIQSKSTDQQTQIKQRQTMLPGDVSYRTQHVFASTTQQIRKKNSTKTAEDNNCFKTTTKPFYSFVPLVQERWINNNFQPSKNDLRMIPNVSEDIDIYAENNNQWKEKTLLDQLPFYAKAKEYKIMICTWNINQGIYSPEIISKWTSLICHDPDIVVCGVQELDMRVNAIITGKKYSEKAEKWQSLIISSLNSNSKDTYVDCGLYQLCGVVLFAFVKESMSKQVEEFGLAECRTGAMGGKLANKGGVAIGMKLFDSRICFVNSHLAAHQVFMERRNKDWEDISKMEIKYVKGTNEIIVPLLEHDIVFWMGDLNYRIDMDDATVRRLVTKKDYKQLYENDQLKKCRKENKVFHKFNEAEINFAPTFKVKIDNGEYKENRIPSWCDRILWKTERRHVVISEIYKSYDIYSSDHKPVSSFLKIHVQQTDKEKKKIVEDFIEKALPWYEAISKPNPYFENEFVRFHDVDPLSEYTEKIIIENRGRSIMRLKIKDYDYIKTTYPFANITLSSDKLNIQEGRDKCILKITINFDVYTLHHLQKKQSSEFTFEIEVKGYDKLIPIKVIILARKTCLGHSIENLCKLNQPIKGKVSKSVYIEPPFQIPKEMYRLVEKIKTYPIFLLRNCLNLPADQKQRLMIIDRLDTDSEFPSGLKIRSYIDALILLMGSFQESILHDDFKKDIVRYSDDINLMKKYVAFMMDPLHQYVFVYIIRFIQYLVGKGLDKLKVCRLFSTTLIHVPKNDNDISFACQKIITMMIDIL